MSSRPNTEHAFDRYVSAREFIIASGYESEIEWQGNQSLGKVTESDFLREAAWVILNSGMKEAVVRQKFPAVQAAFHGFVSSVQIVDDRQCCINNARYVFDHPKKIHAILGVACRVVIEGFSSIKAAVAQYGADFLVSFDFIGPVTSRHLAKNLGFPESKADRHLVRVARILGFPSASTLCSALSDLSGDSVSVVDIVIWRFATLRSDYRDWFTNEDNRALKPVRGCRYP